MIADAKHGLHECRRIIWEDIYRVRKYWENYFDVIFDIGAHIGVFSVFMRMRHPNARIIAIEPCKETREYLHRNAKGLGVQIGEWALGNGRPMYFSPNETMSVSHRFVEEPVYGSYQVDSITLPDLFENYKCQSSDSYLLKIDCEGGERYLVGNPEAESILANAEHVSMEVHFGKHGDWLQWKDYDGWIRKRFSKYSIGYHFSSRKVGCGNYVLEKLGGKYNYGK